MSVVDRIIGFMKASRTDLGCFVDREDEIEKIVNEFPCGRLAVVMGPRGCGKSTLAYTLVGALEKISGYTGFYLAYREEEGVLKSLLRVSNVSTRLLRETLRDQLESVSSGLVKVSGLVDLMDLITSIAGRKFLRKREIIVFIDEFRGEAIRVRQVLEVDANTVRWLYGMGYRVKTIYLTSDATASWLQLELGSKIDWYLMWNLSREDFVEIYNNVCKKQCIDYDLLWRIVGGNPRELYVLAIGYKWSLRDYIGEKIAFTRRLFREYMRETRASLEDVLSELKATNRDIDNSSTYPVYKHLVRNNVLMDIDMRFKRLTRITREQWIGDEVAYQIPVYYWLIKTITKQHTLDITPNQVTETIKRE